MYIILRCDKICRSLEGEIHTLLTKWDQTSRNLENSEKNPKCLLSVGILCWSSLMSFILVSHLAFHPSPEMTYMAVIAVLFMIETCIKNLPSKFGSVLNFNMFTISDVKIHTNGCRGSSITNGQNCIKNLTLPEFGQASTASTLTWLL